MIVVDEITCKTIPSIAECVKYLEQNPINEMPLGKYLVNENGTYVMIQEYMTKSISDCGWEAHKKYVDFQYIISGKEKMRVSYLENMQQGQYNPETDFTVCFGDEQKTVALLEGEGIVFFPEDAHMPCLHYENEPICIKKAVFKIPVACF